MTLPAEPPSAPVRRKTWGSKTWDNRTWGSALWSIVKIAGATILVMIFAAVVALGMAAGSKDGRVPIGFQLVRLQLWFQLPKQLNDNTMLTGVRIEGNTFVYEYEVGNPLLPASLGNNVRSAACGDSTMRGSMDIGARYQFEYYAKSGEFLSSVLVTARDCLI